MLPSPSRLRNHNIFEPIPHANPRTPPRQVQPPTKLPFALSPHITLTQPQPTTLSPPNPLASLVLSLPLAQKIHQLILTSRQIEVLTRGHFTDTLNTPHITQYMENLENQYNILREEVECELETAWVNAGLLPAELPTFPTTVGFDRTSDTSVNRNSVAAYKVARDLKRKRDSEDDDEDEVEYMAQLSTSEARYTKKPKQYSVVDDEEEGRWVAPIPVQPIGLPCASIPLPNGAKRKLGGWGFQSAWGVGGGTRYGQGREVQISPTGSAFAGLM